VGIVKIDIFHYFGLCECKLDFGVSEAPTMERLEKRSKKLENVGAERFVNVIKPLHKFTTAFGFVSVKLQDGNLRLSNVFKAKCFLIFYAIVATQYLIELLSVTTLSGSWIIYILGFLCQNLCLDLHLWNSFTGNFKLIEDMSRKLGIVLEYLEPNYKKCRQRIMITIILGIAVPIGIKTFSLLIGVVNSPNAMSEIVAFFKVFCRKISADCTVVMFCTFCILISELFSSLNDELASIPSEKRLYILQICHDILHDVVGLLNKIFGIHLVLILVGSNLFIQMDIFHYFKMILNKFYNIKLDGKELADFHSIAWIFLDTIRIACCFWAACSLKAKVCLRKHRILIVKYLFFCRVK
jgi:hypothetical protein